MSKNGIDKLIKGTSNIKKKSEWNKIHKEVDDFYKQNKSSEEVSLSYMEFLYESTKIKPILSDIVNIIVNKSEEIFEQNSNSKKLLKMYFRILFSLLRKNDDISEIAIKTMVENNVLSEEDIVYIFNWISGSDNVLEKINFGKISKFTNLMREKYASSVEVEVHYLRLLESILLELFDEEEILSILENEFVRFTETQKSEKVAIAYLDIISKFLSAQFEGLQNNELLKKGEKVYKEFQSSEEVAVSYLNFLSRFFSTEDSRNNELLKKVEKVYKKFQSSEEVAVSYLNFLSKFFSTEGSQNNELLEKGEKVYKEFQSSEKVVVSYLNFLYRAPVNNSSISLFKNIEKRIKKAEKEGRNSPIISLAYLQCLLKMRSKENKELKLGRIEKKVEEIYEKYRTHSKNTKKSKEIAIEYVNTLALISFYKNDIKDVENTAKEIKKYIDFESSDEIKTTYISLLLRLSEMDPTKDKREELVDKVKELIPDKITVDNFFMSLNYLTLLRDLSVKQNEENELRKTLDEAEKVVKNIDTSLGSSIRNDWPDYIQIVLNYALCSSLDDLQTKKYVDNALSKVSREAIEKIYDRLIESKTDTVEQRQKFFILIKKLFEKFGQNYRSQFTKDGQDSSFQSIKYRVLYGLTENMPEKDKDLLIDIFILVQQVKYRLIVKKPKELKLAHYTSGKVLQIYLNQKDNEKNNSNAMPDTMVNAMAKAMTNTMPNAIANAMADAMAKAMPNAMPNAIANAMTDAMAKAMANAKAKAMSNASPKAIPYAIKTKSRLRNVNYMNDPSEGNVLDQYLEWGATSEQLSLRPRPWFLMCLTTSIDNLTMWAQYGEKAEGVCVVLDSGDFSEVSSPTDIEWFTMNKNPNDILGSVSSPNNTKPKEFIYHIGYLSIQKTKGMKLERKYNEGLGSEEVKKVNESLKNMKNTINTINTINNNPKLFEKVDKFIEEIRYLFKFADYSYESELRLLKYSPLESDNKNIKIDDSDGVAKLYIERDNPIRIKEVIFGPKFSNPENVTPLLQLLDKNIKFSQSQIPFK